MMSIILVVSPGRVVPAAPGAASGNLSFRDLLPNSTMAKKSSSDSTPRGGRVATDESAEPAGSQPSAARDLSFEAALQDLEQAVAALEGGDLTLQESLDVYERGIARLRVCHQRLSEAEQRIAVLTGLDADGNPVLAPLSDCERSADLQQKQQSRAQRRGVQRRADPPIDDSQALF